MATILVVDDEAMIRESLSMALESKGHTVVSAATGVEGLAKFAKQSFDLVVTDIIMPDKEGLEMILEMRRKKPDTKIIAISGGGRTKTADFLRTAGKFGAMATLKKPFTLAAFFDAMNMCLSEGTKAKTG